MKSFLVLCLLGLFLTSCQNDDLVTPELPVVKWQEDSRFLLDARLQTTSYANQNNLYMLGLNTFSNLGLDNGKEKLLRASIDALGNSTTHKYPVSSKLIAVKSSTSASTIIVYPTNYPSIQTGLVLSMTQIDPGFQELDFVTASQGECMKISDHHVLLIPYKAIDGMKVLLVTLEVTPNPYFQFDEVTIRDTKTILLDSQPYLRTESLSLFNNIFYVANNEATFSITEDGKVQVSRRVGVFKSFLYKQSIYGLFTDGIYQSTNGQSWNLIAEPISTLNMLSYTSLHDTLLIGTFNDQLFQIHIRPKSISMLELENEGLRGNKITSVALFNHKVYVTTLSGVFIKNEEDLLTYKESE